MGRRDPGLAALDGQDHVEAKATIQPKSAMDILVWLRSGKPRWLFNIHHVRDGQTVRMDAVGIHPIEDDSRAKPGSPEYEAAKRSPAAQAIVNRLADEIGIE